MKNLTDPNKIASLKPSYLNRFSNEGIFMVVI